MNLIADTNVLLRLILNDDQVQAQAALEMMETAEQVAISVHVFCELAWVLARRLAMPRADIAAAIRGMIGTHNVVTNRAAVEAGLRMLDAGGDFADGAIAFEGRWLGGDTFVSFDRKAVKLLEQQGVAARLP